MLSRTACGGAGSLHGLELVQSRTFCGASRNITDPQDTSLRLKVSQAPPTPRMSPGPAGHTDHFRQLHLWPPRCGAALPGSSWPWSSRPPVADGTCVRPQLRSPLWVSVNGTNKLASSFQTEEAATAQMPWVTPPTRLQGCQALQLTLYPLPVRRFQTLPPQVASLRFNRVPRACVTLTLKRQA